MSVTFAAYNVVDAEYQEYKEITPEGFDGPDYDNPLSLNVANGNYIRLMQLLGLDHSGYCGTWGDGSLQEVKDKLTFALESLKAMPELDGGTLTEESKGKGGCVWIDCGLPDGYFQMRLTTLLGIVNKAIEVGGVVSFG